MSSIPAAVDLLDEAGTPPDRGLRFDGLAHVELADPSTTISRACGPLHRRARVRLARAGPRPGGPRPAGRGCRRPGAHPRRSSSGPAGTARTTSRSSPTTAPSGTRRLARDVPGAELARRGREAFLNSWARRVVRVCIVGAGVIGSLFAGHLAQVTDVSVLTRREEHARALNEPRPPRLRAARPSTRASRVAAAPDALPQLDLAIVATKATGLEAAAATPSRAASRRRRS